MIGWVFTMAVWAVFGGLYAAAVSYAVTDLVKRALATRPRDEGED